MEGRLPTFALAGNPNSGKTTLFNRLTGANEKVGNYGGVTVEAREGRMFTPHGHERRLIDLPGCYSLSGGSPDERFAASVLRGETGPPPDAVVCVADASNLERHLRLVLEVLDLGIPTVLALNMIDVAERSGLRLDPGTIAEELGIPVVPMQAVSGKGVVELKQALARPLPPPGKHLAAAGHDDLTRTGFIRRLCELAARRPESGELTWSDRIDRWTLHPVLGWVIFAAAMFAVFWSIFTLAVIPMGWIENAVDATGGWAESMLPQGDLRSLVVDGVIAGVGAVVVFLPQILMLFLFIGLLESSGYMARAAMLMDGVMSRAGLSGKAFLPMLSAYACAIPAVLATRTIGSAKERLTTIFVLPWMSCSARLMVYLLLIPLLLGGAAPGWQTALVMIALYATGTLAALVTARILRGRLGPDQSPDHFLLELPPYRPPQWGYIGRHLASRAWSFLHRAGTVILAAMILLWAAETYPRTPGAEPAEQLQNSLLGQTAMAIEPVFVPLGFDGRTGAAVLSAFAAREVFVGSLGQLFALDEEDPVEDAVGRERLRERMAAYTWPDGRPMFTPAAVLSLLVFFVFAMQCLPTTITVARESRSWKWALAQFVFMSGVAWVAALATFQTATLLGYGHG